MIYLAANKRRLLTLLVGAVMSMTAVLLAIQGSVQEAQTQTGDRIAPVPGDGPTYDGPEGKKFATGEIIVKIEEDASPADLKELNRENGARIEEDLPRSDVSVIDLPQDLSVREAVETYEDDPDIEYAEPDYMLDPIQTKTASDPYYSRLYGLDNTGQNGGVQDADIDAPDAWTTTTGSSETIVAVIDEGVDLGHPDLQRNLWKNTDEVPNNGKDDDNNGYVDDVNGWDFANEDKTVYDPDPVSGNGDEHGTHVAGTIAAEANNDIGITGVNWQARIMPLKFLDSGRGYTSDAVEAINYAVANGARISNNSWGGTYYSQSLYDAIERANQAGHLFVAAAGNSGVNTDNTRHYPSSYTNSNVVSVTATDSADQLASFSNFGSNTVDLAAPGVDILSTLPGGRYGWYSGTSMASPHVAGVAALIKSQNSNLSDADLKAKLLQSVEKKENLKGRMVTGGRLNAAEALGARPSTPTEIGVSTSRSRVRYGARIQLAGRLTTSSGRAVSGKQIVLDHRPEGNRRFSRIGQTITSSNGSFLLQDVRPEKNTSYRARFIGAEEGFQSSGSEFRRVVVGTRVSLRTSTRRLKLNRSRRISGSVAPYHQGNVTVQIRRNGKLIARRKASLSRSNYSFTYRPNRPGTYSFRAVFPGHNDHLKGVSSTRKFNVVR